MAAFDPDAYLARPPKPSSAFDPDAYLASKPTTEFDADAYLGTAKQKGPKVLPDTDTSSDFMRGIKNYPGQFESIVGAGQALTGLAAKKLGFEDTGKSLIQKGLGKIEEGESKTVSKKSDEFTAAWEKGIGTVLTDWLPYQVGTGAANIAESLAFAGMGAGVGAVTGFGAGAVPGAAAGFVSKTLVKQGIKEAAEKVLKEEGKEAAQAFVENEAKKVIIATAGKEAFEKGATEYAKAGAKKVGSYAGTGVQAGIHGAGEVGGRAIQEGQQRGENIEDIDLGRVLPMATVHAIADFVNDRIGLGALKIGDTASKSLITEIAKRVGMTGLKETGGEEVQAIAERYGAKLSLTDAEALKEYVNTAAASFAMAVAPGTIGGVRTHLAQQARLQPPTGTEGTQTEAEKKAAAGAPALTDEQFIQRLEDIKAGKITETAPTTKASKPVKGTPEEIAASFVAAYPVGKELDMPIGVTEGANLNVGRLRYVLKSLGIESPTVDKKAGENYRVKAMAALRDYFDKKNAAPIEEGTTDGTQAAQAQQTETQKQEASAAADVAQAQAQAQAQTQTPRKKLDQQQIAAMTDEQLKKEQGNFLWADDEYDLIDAEIAKRRDAFHAAQAAKQTQTTAPKQMADIDKETYDILKQDYAANPTDKDTLEAINALEEEHNMPLTQANATLASRTKASPVRDRTTYELREDKNGDMKPVEVQGEEVGVMSIPLTDKEEAEADAKEYNEALAKYKADPNDLTALGTINSLLEKHGIKTALDFERDANGNIISRNMVPRVVRPAENLHRPWNPKASNAANIKLMKASNRVIKARDEKTIEGSKKGRVYTQVAAIAREIYDRIRGEHNAKAKESNARRENLNEALDAALAHEVRLAKQLAQIEDEIQKLYDPERVAKITKDLKRERKDAIDEAKGEANQRVQAVKARIAKLEEQLKTARKEKNVEGTSAIIHKLKIERITLAKREDELKQAETATNREVKRLETLLEKEQAKPKDAAKLAQLKALENEVTRAHDDAMEALFDAEDELVKTPFMHMLPDWEKKMTPADKNVYFGQITDPSNEQQHRNAAAALLQSYEKGKTKDQSAVQSRIDTAKEKLAKAENENNTEAVGKLQRQIEALTDSLIEASPAAALAITNYNENRQINGRVFGIAFPVWDRLSVEAKKAYLDTIAEYGNLNAPIHQRQAFYELGRVLVAEKENISLTPEQVQREQVRLEAKQKVEAESKKAQEENRKALNEQERVDRQSRALTTEGDLFKLVLKASTNGETVNEILQHLRTKVFNTPGFGLRKGIFKAITDAILSVNLKTKIVLVEDGKLQPGEKAIYDPRTDTIYISRKFASDPATILHEVVHAGTVKVIQQYIADKSKLSISQQRGVRQLIQIMRLTRDKGRKVHSDAYANIYEFVAYALTDSEFQYRLATMEIASLDIFAVEDATERELSAATTRLFLKGAANASRAAEIVQDAAPKSAWTKFKLAIAKTLGIIEEIPRILKGEKTETAGEMFEESERLEKDEGPGTVEVQHRVTNLMMEIAAAFEDILEAQDIKPGEKGVDINSLRATQQPPRQAAMPRTEDSYKLPSDVAPKSFTQHIRELFLTQTGHLRLEYFFQNKRAVLRKLSEQMAKARVIVYTGDKINDIYGQITTAVADAKNYFNAYVDQDLEELNTAVGKYARAAKLTTKEALEKLHPLLEALHEPERRMVKYLLTVPLTPQADAQRAAIVDALDTQVLTEAQAKQLRAMLDGIVFTTDAQGNRTITNNVDTLGDKYDINAPEYNATGMTREDVQKYTDMLRDDPHKEEFKEIVDAMKKLGVSTAELNKIGHYWSQPVSNRVAFYGWEYYIPLKGNPQHSAVDELLDFDSRAMGRELQDSSGAFGGRFSVSKNPILQMSVDATRAAIRAGQRNLTLAIKNAIEQKLIVGKVVDTILFKERTNKEILDKYRGENHIFHYNDDGTIDILLVQDKNLRNAIRQTFKSSSPLIDKANMITGLIAQGHTRYNYNFAPMNFVRDALTNAFVIGADMSPAKAAQYIKAIASIVVNGGMYKAMTAARLLQSGHKADVARLKQLGETDTFFQHMYELTVERGGMVTHLSGLSLKSQFQELKKQIGPSGIMTKKEQFDKFVDTWTNMFEIASRTSAYMVAKQGYLAENLARGMDETTATEEAKARAVSFTKNLANFEQVGEWGKAMGALYMFFRPASTGAARSLQSIAPAFTSLQSAVDALPPSIKSNPTALAEFKKNYAEHQKNAKIMMMSLIALGFFAHTMSKMMAPDDELGRNTVDADDMDRWTRYARFHIPNGISKPLGLGENVVFQMPWGMGLGAFAAAGAQLSAMYDGKTSIGKGLANIFGSIAMDSFVPIPVSKMPITEMPLQWMLDSIAPSMARPALEMALNKNGLGQAIHNEQSRRFGDAYTGGDNIPEIYKDAARGIANATTGDFDWNPNTLYFLTNTYMDGPARVIETLYGINDLAQGQKGFNPKTDIPLMGSFFGSKVNIDAQQFSKVENQIKRIEGVMKQFATDPEREAQYMEKYPFHEAVVEFYNVELNGTLKELRTEANEYRLDKYLSEKDRKELLKLNTMQANIVKNEMIQVFKSYGIEP